MGTTANNTAEKVKNLLGSGATVSQVAGALGLSESRISQICSDEEFMAEVADLRYKSLHRHTTLDDKYDAMEERLLTKLEDTVDQIYKPHEVMRVLSAINAAKRRGQVDPAASQAPQKVVNLTLPKTVVLNYTKTINNQIVQIGDQTLTTLPTAQLEKFAFGVKVQEKLEEWKSDEQRKSPRIAPVEGTVTEAKG